MRDSGMLKFRMIWLLVLFLFHRTSNGQYEVWEHSKGYDGYTPALIEVAQLLLKDLVDKELNRTAAAVLDIAGVGDSFDAGKPADITKLAHKLGLEEFTVRPTTTVTTSKAKEDTPNMLMRAWDFVKSCFFHY